MATCEDAPCCGCCGTNLYGVNQEADFGQDDIYAGTAAADDGPFDDWDEEEFEDDEPEDTEIYQAEDAWLDGSYED